MKKSLRILAAALVLTLVLALAGCTTDITYITEYNDIKVYTGFYTSALLRSLNTALQYVPDDTTDVWAEQIEGKTAETWVTDQAHDAVRQYIALCLMAKERGVELSESDLSNSEKLASYMMSNYDYYANNGVAQVELTQFCEMQFLYQNVFMSLYGAGGEREIPEADVMDYYTSNYLDFRILMFDHYDVDGNAFTGKELTDYNDMVKEYTSMAQDDPSRMDELICTYNAYRTNYLSGGTDTSNPLPTTGDGVTVTDQLVSVDCNNQYDYPTDVLDMIQGLEYGVPTLLNYQDIDFLVCRYEVDTSDETMASLDSTIRLYLKEVEFSNELTEQGATLNLEFNGAATRKYTAKSLDLTTTSAS